MDQKAIQGGGIITGVILIFCALLISPVAIGLAISYASELWWLGLVMCLASILMMYSGIKSIRQSKKLEWQAKEEQQRIQEEVQHIKASYPSIGETRTGIESQTPDQAQSHREVLAYWIFPADEWKKFIALERKRRKSSTFYEFLVVVIFGTLILVFLKATGLWLGFSISLIIALIISWLRYVLTMNAFSKVLPDNTVIITDQSVMINDKLNPYRSENFWLEKIQILDGDPDVLEITYAWNTRKGKTFDELRVPIPKGKREEAQRLIQQILKP